MPFSDESLEITDDNKVVRIRLGLDANNHPNLSLNGSDGKERIVLSVNDKGNGSLEFRTATGQPVVSMGISSVLGMGMMMLDVQNEVCLTLNIANSDGGIRLETKEGTHVWPDARNENVDS